MSKLIDNLKQQKAFSRKMTDDIPYNAWKFFGSNEMFKFDISGTSVSITKDGDYMNIVEARDALNYWIELFGGKVNWDEVTL